MKRKFSLDIFNTEVVLVTTRKECQALTDHAFPDDLHECDGVCRPFNNQYYVVGVFNGKIATLVHELTHVAIRVCEAHGINIEIENSETFCYVLEYLVKKSLELFPGKFH